MDGIGRLGTLGIPDRNFHLALISPQGPHSNDAGCGNKYLGSTFTGSQRLLGSSAVNSNLAWLISGRFALSACSAHVGHQGSEETCQYSMPLPDPQGSYPKLSWPLSLALEGGRKREEGGAEGK